MQAEGDKTACQNTKEGAREGGKECRCARRGLTVQVHPTGVDEVVVLEPPGHRKRFIDLRGGSHMQAVHLEGGAGGACACREG